MTSRSTAIAVIRGQISAAAAHLFGRPVSFEERALQALEVVTRAGRTPTAAHVWARLAESVPAIHQLYDTLGISFDGVPTHWPPRSIILDPYSHDVDAIDWMRLLQRIFCIEDAVTGAFRHTAASEHVAREGTITVRELATSLFQAGRISRHPQGPQRMTNLAFRALARGAGLEEPRYWTQEVDSFASRAVATFDQIYASDPSCGSQQFILYFDARTVRIAPFGVFGAYRLQEAPLPDGSLWIARGNLVQPARRFTSDAISHLEQLINTAAPEAQFQKFFEEHPEFLLALGDYVRLHPQVVLTEDTGSSLIPDFFLEKINSTFCDICDLKRPTAELVRNQRNRRRFRDAVMEAVAQLTYYRDWFDDREHRQSFLQRYGLQAYRPKVVIVIGRRHSFYDEVERIHLESQLPNWVLLKTYDDVANAAKKWIRLLATE